MELALPRVWRNVFFTGLMTAAPICAAEDANHLGEAWLDACENCHSTQTSNSSSLTDLRKLDPALVAAQLRRYQGEPSIGTYSAMWRIAKGLTPADVASIEAALRRPQK